MKRFLAILLLSPLVALGQPLSNSFNAIIAGTVNATTNFVGEGGGITLANDATNSVQAVRLSQLQNLLPSSSTYYLYGSSNAFAASFGVGTTANTNYCYNVPSSGGANTMTVNGVTTGEYLVSYVTADTFKAIGAGSINVDFYASFNSGAGRACSLVAEIYVLDTVANSLVVEYGTPVAQAITGSSAEYVFTVAATNYTSANPLRLVAKIKVATQANNPNVSIVTENGQASHIDFNIPSSSFVLKSGDTMTGALIGTTSTMTTVNDATVNAGALNVTNTATIATIAAATETVGTWTATNAPTIKATGLSINGVSLAFPSTNATANQLLRNDGSGNLTWTNVSSGAGLANTVLGPGSATVAGNPVTWADTTGTNVNTSATPNGGSFTNLNQSGLLSLNSAYWRAAQANLLLQSNTQWTIAFLGDSWTSASTNSYSGSGAGFPFALRNALQAQYGNAGDGWLSASTYNGLWYHGSGTMLLYTNGGDVSTWVIGQDYIGNNNANSSPFLTCTNYCRTMVLYFENHYGGGTTAATVKTNGVTYGSTSTTAGFQTYTVTFPVLATNVLEIDFGVNCYGLNWYGIDFINDASGVRVGWFGKGARQAGDIISGVNLTSIQNDLTNFHPSVVYCDLGQNDLDAGNIATLGASMYAIITNIQTQCPKASIYIASRPDVAITNSGNSMLTVEGIVRAVCATNNVTYIDAYHPSPRYSQGLSLGLYYDTKHYNTWGYAMYADLIYRTLMGGPMTMNYHP